ncbi:MAG: hypothetical protein COB35_03300 [Gammaproteobacteria bacterium]|nr:MAG: hypothetical protein COB35_03300 [Gammaproteobacteria bacterium]
MSKIKSIILKISFLLLITLLLIVLAGLTVFEQKINQPLKLDQNTLLTVGSGTSIGQLSQQLLAQHWLKNRFWLRNYPRFYTQFADIKAGTYQIKIGTTAKQLLAQLVAGKEHQFEITFIEGTTFKQWLLLLQQQPYLNHNLKNKKISQITQLLAIKHANPEGLFFPDTYAYTAGTDELTLLRRAHQRMEKILQQQWQTRATGLPYSNAYQALIMASIIEKETSKLAEQPLIASVFTNRLFKKMRLQTDPTIIYGLGDRYQGDIKRAHKYEKTAYNTYRINGLPPTPIAMPGESALSAVMHPAATSYLYFVSKGNGYHQFSDNLKDHNRAVNLFQRKKK